MWELEAAIGIVTAYALAALLSWLPFLLYGVDPLAALFGGGIRAIDLWPLSAGSPVRAASAAENRAVRGYADGAGGGDGFHSGFTREPGGAERRKKHENRIDRSGTNHGRRGGNSDPPPSGGGDRRAGQGTHRSAGGYTDCGFIHGDGSKPAVLREVGPQHTDVLCCFTDNDQSNILASLVGRSLGFRRIFTKIDDAEFQPICIELGLTDLIIPHLQAARALADLAFGTLPEDFAEFFKCGGAAVFPDRPRGGCGSGRGTVATETLRGHLRLPPR